MDVQEVAPTSSRQRILKADGLPPVAERPTSWQTFLRAHWGVIAGADFFTTEVWTWQRLVTFYTVFVIDLASRRVQIVGSTTDPDELFMRPAGRTFTTAEDGLLHDHRVLLCDRHFRRALAAYVDPDHRERNHPALGNRLIEGVATAQRAGWIRRRPRLGGVLNYYERAA
jgi:transposase InsO family protein